MRPESRNYIDGRWTAADNAAPDINPSDVNDIVGEYPDSSEGDVRSAIHAARRSFPEWSRTSPHARANILAAAAAEILKRARELGELLSREQGKTLREGQGEVIRAGQAMQFMAGEAIRIRGDSIVGLGSNSSIEVIREPLGVIGVITPWNFPAAIPVFKIAAALAYGNTVVFKPSELVPASASELVSVLERAGLPAGALNLVMGSGPLLGSAIASDAAVDAVSFTGSVSTGRLVASAAVNGATMKRLQLEMGGKNPLVVLDDADLELAASCALDGAFFSTGQRCTASSRIIVTRGIHDRFVNALVDRLRGLRVGHALDEATNIGPVVSAPQLERIHEYIGIGRREGANLYFGGRSVERETPGYFLEPALFTEATNSMRICREEIFGPVAAVICVKDYEEALATANDTNFGLSAGICTSSLAYASHFKRNIQSGTVKVNQSTSGLDFHVPFGGRKDSAYGPPEQGTYAVEFFTSTKVVYTSA